MSKRLIIGLSLLVLATNSISFWAGKHAKGLTTDPVPAYMEASKPSEKQIENACYLSYVDDVESDQTTKAQVVSVQGKWLSSDSTYLCAVKGYHLVMRDNALIEKPLVQTYFVLREDFVLREELVLKTISESEFAKLVDK